MYNKVANLHVVATKGPGIITCFMKAMSNVFESAPRGIG